MISWMQKHNKYFVITMWIAGIALVGAYGVGWGSFKYGSRANNVGEVGDIKISIGKYQYVKEMLYEQEARKYGSKFDNELAKKLKLSQRAFDLLAYDALLLNLAKEYGIIATDEEVAEYIAKSPLFQNKGVFDEKIYQNFLKQRGLKAETYEGLVRDQIIIDKLMKLINKKSLPFEREVIASALSIKDKIKYSVIGLNDINVSVKEDEIKNYWQKHKNNYMTQKMAVLEVLETKVDDINTTEKELKDFYEKNSFNYINSKGEILKFNEAKDKVLKDLKIKKGKKRALLDYIALKKGKKSGKKREIVLGSQELPKEAWDKIKALKMGQVSKPIVVGDKYLTIKLLNYKEPQIMDYKDAKELAKKELIKVKKEELLAKEVESLIKDPTKLKFETKDYISLGKVETLNGLSMPESIKFLSNLFVINKSVDKIRVDNKVVVFKIVDQKMSKPSKETLKSLAKDSDLLKMSLFKGELINTLMKKYKIVRY
ncbi:MAG: hypothetical protein GXO02_00245 [Epsilonproteobacteria bacterium]|nr:hypothetical protein [Campylobacterota bacterium]